MILEEASTLSDFEDPFSAASQLFRIRVAVLILSILGVLTLADFHVPSGVRRHPLTMPLLSASRGRAGCVGT